MSIESVLKYKFHDAYFFGVSLREGEATLSFKLEGGKVVHANLCGLMQLQCDELKESNIILDVTLSNDIDICAPLLHQLLGSDYDKEGDLVYLDSIKQKLKEKSAVLFHIAPSYGGELIALCKYVNVVEED